LLSYLKVMSGVAIAGFEQVLGELDEVETQLGRALDSGVPFVRGLGQFLQRAKGKRLRPALAVLFYKLLGQAGDRDALLKLAAVLELIHLATLVHDDVIDCASTRRDQATLHVHTSNRVAILEGDYLFVRVFDAVNSYPQATRDLIILTVKQILEGELLQESLRGSVPSAQQYFEVTQGKTAVLIAAACSLGAQWGNPRLAEEKRRSIYEAGMLMGQAFQLVDDLLDVYGDEQIGKPRWSDLRGGWLTLPLIRLVEQDNSYRAALLSGTLDGSLERRIQDGLLSQGVRAQIESQAAQMLAQAVENLSWLPASRLRSTLFETIDFMAKRRN